MKKYFAGKRQDFSMCYEARLDHDHRSLGSNNWVPATAGLEFYYLSGRMLTF
jgi:hypothetical protein